MDARRPGRLLVVALVAAALFTVALSAPAVAATTLSIHRHPKVVEYTFVGRIFGTLSTGARGRKLLLQRRVWPFTGAVQTVASTRTRRHGRYRFAVSPTIATRYRVVLASNPAVRSRATTVYVKSLVVSSRCTIGGQRCSRSLRLSPGRHRLTVVERMQWPAIVYPRESTKSVYWYYGQRNGSAHAPRSLGRKAVNHQGLLPSQSARWHFRHTVRVPRGTWTFRVVSCTRDTYRKDGFGLPGRHHCGASRITLRQSRHYLG
jgi:hypothetical protein